MSARELRLSDVLGRVVHDVDGRRVGRVEELLAELELHEHGNDYVVTGFHVASYGALETLGGLELGRHLVAKLGRRVGYRIYEVPWDAMDLSDPRHPRVTMRKDELRE